MAAMMVMVSGVRRSWPQQGGLGYCCTVYSSTGLGQGPGCALRPLPRRFGLLKRRVSEAALV
jgi:hypothetical protein